MRLIKKKNVVELFDLLWEITQKKLSSSLTSIEQVLHRKRGLPLRISSVNVTKPAISCGGASIYRSKKTFSRKIGKHTIFTCD